jgi:putative nucleotidyltransferase with HDIG domain
LELTIFVLAGGLVAAVSLGRVERISAFLVSGMAVGVANALAVSIFRLAPRDYDWPTLGLLLLAGTGNGLLAGLLALGSLSIFGRIFGITTTLELVDLARPTHPLIQKLIREAPGTYHHSLIVSNLAEQAAQRIGADALLVRVAAYYHDIGKTANPLYFIENQMDGVNIHDALDPRTSAGFIIQHVPDGLALAKKHRLPARIRDFIAQHHGMTLAAYFYRKATIAASGTRVDENEFRYPGPKPRTREAAIFMLADGVEATARAERPGSPEAIREIIERIIGARLGDGQLDEADLTLRELDQVKEAFFDIMQGIFHPRVKYPEPTEMEKKRRLASLVLPPEPVESDR